VNLRKIYSSNIFVNKIYQTGPGRLVHGVSFLFRWFIFLKWRPILKKLLFVAVVPFVAHREREVAQWGEDNPP
jgi:hypothetical protein